MKQQLRLNYNSSKMRVCVDNTDGSAVSGRVFSQRLKDILFFQDLNSLVLRLDKLMDEQNYPQAFQRKRSFKSLQAQSRVSKSAAAPEEDDRPYMDEETVAAAVGEKATFILQVQSRQNTNWQGFVEFPDGAGNREFESELGFLELVKDLLSN
ncbi:MAG: hypothetical protein LBK57_03920 [Clostridiales Family XIII bacterium]|jgi:hypothetical protein|nr:hypothetical protein [Clostridiales Family XIII bacterium]